MKKGLSNKKIHFLVGLITVSLLLTSALATGSITNTTYNISEKKVSHFINENDFGLVVSDGITNNDPQNNDEEIPPGVTLYQFINNNPFFKYLFSKRIEGAKVWFYIRDQSSQTEEWILLNDEPILTDEEGQAYLISLKNLIPSSVLDLAPIDLQLMAVAQIDEQTEAIDDNGMIRILDKTTNQNNQILAVDHDNTLHATGGSNALVDIVRFTNWAKLEWPLVDSFVQDAIIGLHENNTDIIVVTGLPNVLRALCREQVNLHFENRQTRYIPIIIKTDQPFEESNEFKAETLETIEYLYGEENFIAMVGDTVRQDGYGAYANELRYIPYQIHYRGNIDLLDTEGYGYITPESIADDWSEVLSFIDQQETINNYFLQNKNGFLNIAHRGGGDLRPENTILCYRNALDVGADVLEGDLHATNDGVIVVSHDATVDRCTNGTGNITDYTFEELRSLDAGYWFTTDNGETYPYRGFSFNGADHLQIPTLGEVFSDPIVDNAPMILEIKQQDPSIIEDVLDYIEMYDMQDRVVIGSFDKESLDEIRNKSSQREMELITSFCEDEVLQFYLTPLPTMLYGSYAPPGLILQVPTDYELSGINVPVTTPFFMNKARHLGLKVQVWTINDPEQMQWLIDQRNVDGIMTDNPEILENLLNNQ